MDAPNSMASRMSSLFDEAGASPQDRFMFMMFERVQALEGVVASLEADSLTDSMSVQLENDNALDLGGLERRMFGGGDPEPEAPDWDAFAARFAQAVAGRRGGVQLCEVVVEQVPYAKPICMEGAGHMRGMMDTLNNVLNRMTTKMFLTARLRSKQPVAAVERTLVGALDALGAVKATGSWKPTDVSGVRASCRNAAAGAVSWTWRAADAPAHEPAPSPAGPKQEREGDAEVMSAGRFAMLLSTMLAMLGAQ